MKKTKLKIIRNDSIQAEVNRHASKHVNEVAALSIPSLALFDEKPKAIHDKGIKTALQLLNIRKTYWDDAKIYEATQETSEGEDVFYFIGRRSQILRELRKLPEAIEPGTQLGIKE